MFAQVVSGLANELANWHFWLWLTLCVVANFGVKNTESGSLAGFLVFATIRALVVAAGAAFYLAKSAQPAIELDLARWSLLGIGVVAAVASLLVLNQLPVLRRVFVSESVQVYWEGAVPSLLLFGLNGLAWSAGVGLALTLAAQILGFLLVAIPATYFALTRQMGTARERRLSAWISPVLNVLGGLVVLQFYLVFLVTSRA